mgnify:CR=1 FL=1
MKQVKPKKFLGQHFLKDLSIAKAIADTVDKHPSLPILEVGPGMGVLTQYLITKDRTVDVVEIDYESVAYLRERFPEVTFIENTENVGFARANNQAIRLSTGEYVLLLNPDNRYFATGFHSSAGAVIATAKDAWFITDSRYIEAATEFAGDRFKVLQNSNAHPMNDLIKVILSEQGVSKLLRLDLNQMEEYLGIVE